MNIIIKNDNDLKQLLSLNKHLILKNDFLTIYRSLNPMCRTILTQFLLDASINPLLYMDHIPANYCQNNEDITYVDIPNNISSIGGNAFFNCKNLKYLKLNKGLEAISDNAFKFCYSLESIDIPDSVKFLGTRCFCGCREAKTIKIGSGLHEIPFHCFFECKSVTSVEIPKTVAEVNFYAFEKCSSLTDIYIYPDTRILAAAFDLCVNLSTIHYNGTREEFNNSESRKYLESLNVEIKFTK